MLPSVRLRSTLLLFTYDFVKVVAFAGAGLALVLPESDTASVYPTDRDFLV